MPGIPSVKGAFRPVPYPPGMRAAVWTPILLAAVWLMGTSAVDAKTLLLSHFDGGSGQGGANADLALGGRVAEFAQGLSVVTGRFGNALYFPGNTNANVHLLYRAVGNIRNDRGTIDFWYIPKFDSSTIPAGVHLLAIWNTVDTRFMDLSIGVDGKVGLYSVTFPCGVSAGVTFKAGQPVHFAATWNNTNGVHVFINGTNAVVVNATWAANSCTQSTINVGSYYPAYPNVACGAIDEFRITDQVEYSGDFTPPTAPYANVIDFNAPSSPIMAMLASNGLATAAIVMAPEPTRSAQFAGAELRAHVKQITGADLPTVVDTVTITNGLRILVGESAATRALGYSNSTFSNQEYTVKYTNSSLILMGRDANDGGMVSYDNGQSWPGWCDDQATCYAVYDFLERNCGVRWFNPTEFGTFCLNTATLSVNVPDVRRSPFFKMRTGTHLENFQQYDAGVETLWPAYLAGFTNYVSAAYPDALNGAGGSQVVFDGARSRAAQLFLHRMRAGGERNHCNHTLYWYGRFGNSHTNWFAQGWPWTNNANSHLCYDNVEVRAQLAADADAYYNGINSSTLGIGWGPILPNEFPIEPPDTGFFCLCANCQSWMNRDTSWFFSKSNHSDYVFNFINQAAVALQKSHPGKRIVSLAYAGYAALPRRISVNTNVDVQFCFATSQSPCAPVQYKHELDYLRDWSDESLISGRKLYLWLYPTWWTFASLYPEGRYNCFPSYVAHTIARQFALFSTNNVRGMCYCGWGPEVDGYVTSQLMNSPTQDVDNLLNEYFSRMYGPAAGTMSNIYSTIEDIFNSPSNYPPEGMSVPNKAIDWSWRGTAERMASLSNLMADAVGAVTQGTIYATNVNLFKIGTWDYMVSGRQEFMGAHCPPRVSIVAPTNGATTNAPVTLTASVAPITDNTVTLGVGNVSVLSPGWHHVMVTFNATDGAAGKMEMFVDGVSQGTQSYLPAGGKNTTLEMAGRYGAGLYEGFAGEIDELRLSSCVRDGWATYTNQLTQAPTKDAFTTLLLHMNSTSELATAGAYFYGTTPVFVAGFHSSHGNALSVDGATAYIVPNSGLDDEVGTWEAWVRFRAGVNNDNACILMALGVGNYQALKGSYKGVSYAEQSPGFKVKYYDGGTLIGTAISAPFTFTWATPSPGSHTLTAQSTEIFNLKSASAPVTVNITN